MNIFKKKKIKAISKGTKSPESMKRLRSFIGRRVRSKSGNNVGVIADVLVDGGKVMGYLVAKPLSVLFISKDYFSSFSKRTAMLSIDPVTMLVGKQVFDADGKKLGRVSRLQRKGNENSFDALVVKKNPFSKGLVVPKEDISVLKRSIILKVVYE